MPKVSVIIPSRNERFLPETVADVLSKARGDLELIVILDGYWPNPPLASDPRLHILHHGTAQGMRPSINAAVGIATGDYLMKLDAHCMLAEGFDETLKADCDQDWIVVPRRYPLDPERWILEERTDRKYPIDYHYLSYPFERPDDPTCGLHGTAWQQRRDARSEILLDEEMSSQGSCWFMSKAHWDRLGPMDVANYGTFQQEFQELGLKTWLGGGRVMVNKKTWYAHLWKGKRYGRGYSFSGARCDEGRTFTNDHWMHDRWRDRMHDLRWLIERFSPVPTWPADLDAAFPKTDAMVSVPAPSTPVLSYCVPCHRRLDDLQQALPSVIAAANASAPVELVIVDYGEQAPLAPILAPLLATLQPPNHATVVSSKRYAHFHMAHARNVSIKAASGAYVVISSTDVLLQPDFFTHVRERLSESGASFLRPRPNYRGVIVCFKEDLIAVGGYDERMEFYGPEDKELEARLMRRHGLAYSEYDSRVLSVIPTPDAVKTSGYRLPLSKGAMHRHGKAILAENAQRAAQTVNEGIAWGQP